MEYSKFLCNKYILYFYSIKSFILILDFVYFEKKLVKTTKLKREKFENLNWLKKEKENLNDLVMLFGHYLHIFNGVHPP